MQKETSWSASMKSFDRSAFRVGCVVAFAVMATIYAGSRQLKDFDWALTTYAVGTIFAAFALPYRYAQWSERPPTKLYLKRGLQMFLRRYSLFSCNSGRFGELPLDVCVYKNCIN